MLSCVQLYDPIPSRLLCPWGFSSKNTRVGCHFILQGNLPDPGIEPMSLVSPALAGGFFTLSHLEINLSWLFKNAFSVFFYLLKDNCFAEICFCQTST